MTSLPWHVTAIIVVVDLLVATVICRGLVAAGLRAGFSHARANKLGWGVAALIALWVSTSVLLSLTFIAKRPMVPANGAAFVSLLMCPVFVISVLLMRKDWQRVVSATPQHWIIGLELYRVVGGVFLITASAGFLPMWFAKPTAYGDFVAGFSAPGVALLAYKRISSWKAAVLIWNVAGLADFVMALGLGSQLLFVAKAKTLFGNQAISTSIVRELPLVLIPQFVVPVGIALHILSLWKLRVAARDR